MSKKLTCCGHCVLTNIPVHGPCDSCLLLCGMNIVDCYHLYNPVYIAVNGTDADHMPALCVTTDGAIG